MDLGDIKDLIIAIDKTTIERVEIEKSDLKIVISRGTNDKNGTLRSDTDNLEYSDISTGMTDEDVLQFENETDRIKYGKRSADDENTFIVKSPMVGIFYRAPDPDSLPFADVGDMVEQGQTICIIEAMKIMNEIECEYKGKIIEIFAEDEDIVEYGQPLMLIRE